MSGESNDKVVDITVEILKQIRDEARNTNARLDETNARLDETNARLEQGFGNLSQRIDGLQAEMHRGFVTLGDRIDNLLRGEHRKEHEQLRERVARIEHELGITQT